MQTQEKIDREVRILSLLRESLRHWRIILILALVFALLGAFLYERSFKKELSKAEEERALQLAAREEAAEAVRDNLEGDDREEEMTILEDFSNLNLQNVEKLIFEVESKGMVSVRELLTSVEALDRTMEGMRTYLASSLKLRIDPNNTQQAIYEVFVDNPLPAEGEEDVVLPLETRNHILARYRLFLISSVSYDALAEAFGCEAQYLRELVSVSVDYDAGVVRFTVLQSTVESAMRIANDLADQVERAKDLAVADYGPYRLTVVRGDARTIYNSDLSNYAANTWKNYFTAETTVNSYKKRVSEALRILAAGGETGLVGIDPEQELTPLPQHSGKKLILYGVGAYFLGVVVLTFLAMLLILLRGRIVDGNDLAALGIRTLTELPAKRKGKALRGLDALLDGIGRTKDFTGSEQERLAKAAAFIREYADGAGRLLLTGDVEQGKLQALANDLSAHGGLPELVCHTSLFTNPSTVEALKDCEGIVLVEEPAKSAYRLALQDVRVAVEWNKPVIGAIYL